MIIHSLKQVKKTQSLVFWSTDKSIEKELNEVQLKFLRKKIREKAEFITIDQQDRFVFVLALKKQKELHVEWEFYRKTGAKIFNVINKEQVKTLHVEANNIDEAIVKSLIEGIALASYSFTKYHSDEKRNKTYLQSISVNSEIQDDTLEEMAQVYKAVGFARDLVNEPLSYLTAHQLGEEVKQSAKTYGYTAQVLEKKQIESLKMGGLLAVNKGSFDPPTFSILEWKPKNPKNEQPIIFVGKGVVFDTGGLSLKPTAGSMDEMKSDMGGAASVIGAMQAIAANKLNVHVIALVPATDNRPGNNAYAPQDIITMHDGTKVEVLNTDAEGRMILADALSYAKQYNPELVIDLATLTGAAHAAIGPYGIVSMGNAANKYKSKLALSGDRVYERLVEFPFWSEYEDLIKSDIGDIKNIGGKVGGAITAGKFLEHFTDYPYIHLDIAGPAYIPATDAYRTKGGTGVGVRLLYDFIKQY